MRLFPDAKRRNDVEERSTLKRRRLLLETCDRPEASAPLPRHASKQLHQRRPPTQRLSRQPDPYPPAVPGAPPPAGAQTGAPRTTGTGKLEWSVSREGAHEGAAGGASTTHTTRPEEPQQHTPTWPSWISHTASQHPTGPRGEPGQRNGWTLAPGDWPKESALREHRNILIRDQLQRGMTVAYRTSSTSTTSATSNPSWSAVEPGWRYYAHFIKVRMSSASL